MLLFAIGIFSPLTTLVLPIQEAASTYAESARVVGASSLRIMFRHILPNLMPLAIVNASIIIPAAILAEASLADSVLGRRHRAERTRLHDPGLPGIALSLTVLAFNFLGDSLRDVLDPRLRGSGLV